MAFEESDNQKPSGSERQPKPDFGSARDAVEDQGDDPLVSVIVPVFNNPRGIERCVGALQRQTYPAHRHQLIVVDDGSTDATGSVIARLGVTSVRETSSRGSYAARNAGLREASGTVVAFTDADCCPGERWLEEGVRALKNLKADLVGGRVSFELPRRPSGAEIWDSITNMQVEQNIRERGVAKTANLFVRRSLFDAIGPFASELRSGGDVAWTGEATRRGYILAFAPTAEITHPARRLSQLVPKQYRVGVGKAMVADRSHASRWGLCHQALRYIIPPSRSLIDTQLEAKRTPVTGVDFMRVWGAAWMCRAATGLGTLISIIRRPAFGRRNT